MAKLALRTLLFAALALLPSASWAVALLIVELHSGNLREMTRRLGGAYLSP